jgi:hypothetical protein
VCREQTTLPCTPNTHYPCPGRFPPSPAKPESAAPKPRTAATPPLASMRPLLPCTSARPPHRASHLCRRAACPSRRALNHRPVAPPSGPCPSPAGGSAYCQPGDRVGHGLLVISIIPCRRVDRDRTPEYSSKPSVQGAYS